jgi:beta-glucosidase-like glycosyl hydrolase
VGGFLRNHGYDASAASTVRAVLGAGVDTDCGGGTTPLWSNDTLLELMTNASTQETIEPLIDASLKRLFTVRMRLGQFDPPSIQPWGKYGLEQVDTAAHRELAMEAALQVSGTNHWVHGRGLRHKSSNDRPSNCDCLLLIAFRDSSF